jgi:hypothetical protein
VTKKTSTAVNVKKVRRAFAEKYFPEIVTPKKKKGKTFLDLVNEL